MPNAMSAASVDTDVSRGCQVALYQRVLYMQERKQRVLRDLVQLLQFNTVVLGAMLPGTDGCPGVS